MSKSALAATIKKSYWVLRQYDGLLPEGQAAIDAALLALPHRPVSKRSRHRAQGIAASHPKLQAWRRSRQAELDLKAKA